MSSSSSGRPIEHRRTLNVFVLAMLSLAVVISLRNLPLSAEYGLASLFFYLAATLVFMIPYALVSAELASAWPKAGGIYIWVREALGDRWGFFAIWMQWFHNMTWYPAMLAFIAAGIAQLINPNLAHNKVYLICVILGGFWSVTLMNFFGIKLSAWLSTVCVIVGSIIPGVLLIFFGIYWVATGHPLAIDLTAKKLLPNLHDLSHLVFLAGIFLALAGLEANANLAREVKNPQKNYPRAILIAALLAFGILVLGSLSIAIVIPQKDISLVSGLLDAFHIFFNKYGVGWIVPIIAIFTVLGAFGELNAWAMAGVRGLFVTIEHGNLPPIFHKLNKRHVPVNLLIFQAVIVTIAAFIFLYLPNVNISYWILSALAAQMYLVMYILLFITGIVLRIRKPHVPRVYRVPFKNGGMWVASIIGTAACLFAITVSFIPPLTFKIKSILQYESILIAGFVISVAIPLVIFAFKKPHWKVKVLEKIRKEIRKSIH